MQNNVSNEDRLKVYELCKRELCGKWAEVNQDDLLIKPVTDGFVNKLFFCFLPESIETKYNKLVVRYVDYEMMKDFYDVPHVLAISLILSEKGISPKILSVFENGTIMECIDECRYLKVDDYQNPNLIGLIAKKLAIFHSLKMPVPKDSSEATLEGIYDKWFDAKLRQTLRDGKVYEEIQKHNYKTFMKLNFEEEMDWLKKTLLHIKSPIVFSHNDYNRRNILIRETNNNSKPEIFLIDFDWSNYNYRGYDFGQFFCTWAQEENDFGHGDFPDDQQMHHFIDVYIQEMTQIFGVSYNKFDVNSRERLIKESKVFALMAFVKDILYCIWKVAFENDKEILAKAEIRFECYSQLKTRILNEYFHELNEN